MFRALFLFGESSVNASVNVAPPTVESLAAAVGRTPLVRLRRFETQPQVALYAKLESRDRTQAVLSGMRLGIVQLQ